MWRKFFKRFGCRVVATEDNDGAIRYRFVRRTPFGKDWVASIMKENPVILNDDGTCGGGGAAYVKRWMKI